MAYVLRPDIAKLKGHAELTYFDLYVILDVFSRYMVGWMVTIHADRGSSMTSKPVAFLLADSRHPKGGLDQQTSREQNSAGVSQTS